MRALRIAALALLAPFPLGPAMAQETNVLLHFDAFSHGLGVLHMDAALRLTASGYGIKVSYHTIGLAGLFYPGHEDDSASGAFNQTGAEPVQYLAEGTWRGNWRETRVTYRGQTPSLVTAIPPIAEERRPLPSNLLPGTIDTLSALVDLIRHVETAGTCNTTVRVYDGRRLSEIQAASASQQVLEARAGSVFSGPALKCDFSGQMLAGFMFDHPPGEPGCPYHGSAWIARLTPGGPPLPVRLSFETHWLGDVTMYLSGIDRAQEIVQK